MSRSVKYAKIVEWSEEDNCYMGSCPGLFYHACRGSNEQAVFAELCQLVDETLSLYIGEGRVLPQATAGYDWASLFPKS